MTVVPVDVELWLVQWVRDQYPFFTVGTDIPPKWDWGAPATPLVVVSIVGGNGIRDHGFDDVRVTFEVYDPDVDAASETVRTLYGRAREVQHEFRGVFFRGTVLRPVYHPIGGGSGDPGFTPGYWFTVEFTFRAEELSA